MLLVEGQRLPGFQFVRAGFLHPIVEAGNENLAVFILELGNNSGQRLERIGRGTAIHARVQINHGAGGLNLGIDHAAQTDTQRWRLGGEHFRIGDQSKLRLQTVGVISYIGRYGFTAHFLLALDK